MVEIDERVGGPDLLSELLACNDLSRPLNKDPEDLYGLPLDRKTNAAVTQLAGAQIQLERTKPYNGIRTRCCHWTIPEGGEVTTDTPPKTGGASATRSRMATYERMLKGARKVV